MPSQRFNTAVPRQGSFARLVAGEIGYRLCPPGPHGGDYEGSESGGLARDPESLPFKVELWDEAKVSVEQVLAVTANGSIGYAAYYAATREHPNRYITLRHNNSIVSRWNGPSH
jgi:hypothetical protein